ncbi:MAG: competence type IV pilus minor pilin ComGG [Heyndrickxia sp.]
MKNEKGFILPFTLMVTFVVFFLILSSVQIYLSESRYLQEAKGYYIRNSMVSLSMKTLMEHFENQKIEEYGVISFEEGTVSFQIRPIEEHQYRIILTTRLSNGQETKNELIYDKAEKRILKWIES